MHTLITFAMKDVANGNCVELDKARGTAQAGAFGGSIFGSSLAPSSLPSELRELMIPQQAVSKQLLPVKSSLSTANTEYDKLTDPKNPLPAPPVYAAKLSGLLKHLANAENAVAQSVKARKELVAALEKILHSNRTALGADEAQHKQLSARKAEIEIKRQEVELEIIRGMGGPEGTSDSPHDAGGPLASPIGNDFNEPDRPEMEALTPPPATDDDHDFYDNSPGQQNMQNGEQTHAPEDQQQAAYPTAASGIEMLSNLASQYQSVPVAVNGSNKRRRVDSGDDFPDLGGDDGIDADVAEMLRKDSHGS